MAEFISQNTNYTDQEGEKRYEVVMLAAGKDGSIVEATHPLPVTLGSENITITGSVNVGSTVEVISTPENPVHTHLSEVGTSGILTIPNLPISIQDNAGNINSSTYPVYVTGDVSVVPEALPELYSFNNFGVNVHRGWTFSDTLIPMFSVRAKSSATKTVRILNYDIGNNNFASSTVGYVWLEDATITGTVPAWTSLNTEAEYRVYTDAYGSNTPNGFTGGIKRHAGIMVGKNSNAEEDIEDLSMTAGGITLTLCVMRLDGNPKIDMWFAADLGIFN